MSPSATLADIDLADLAQSNEQRFVLLPSFWVGFRYSGPLAWTSVPFTSANAAGIPDSAGVYAFLIQPGIAGNLNVSYLMYVGEAKSLAARYRDYLAESRGVKARARLLRMFTKYSDHLHFAYAHVPRLRKRVEAHLLEAFWPPVNHELPATIRAAKRAFQ